MTSNVFLFLKKGESLSSRSDDNLMLLAAQGISGSFEELVCRHGRRVFEYCARYLGDRQRGEAMAQEIWTAVWQRRGEYRPEGEFLVWLFTLVRDRARRARRERAHKPTVAVPDDPALILTNAPNLPPNVIERLRVVERRGRLDRALSAMPEPLCAAVLLRFTEELSYGEIAQILDTNESTIRSRVLRGLRELRRRLKEGVMKHATEEQLFELVDGGDAPNQEAELRAHIAGCLVCRIALEEIWQLSIDLAPSDMFDKGTHATRVMAAVAAHQELRRVVPSPTRFRRLGRWIPPVTVAIAIAAGVLRFVRPGLGHDARRVRGSRERP